mmetsp:Transcript_54537/g.162938  ORF Transcript_54537/g.162938 Transcript_54537/m.162938 type:complete len:138 (+) Transcript_54537:285-698(+)
MEYQSDNHIPTPVPASAPGIDEKTIITVILVVLLFVSLVAPCCINKRRRKTCIRRIRERTLYVDIEEEPEDQWFIAAMERYRASQAAEVRGAASVSNAEERQRERHDEECRLVLLERLSEFTMVSVSQNRVIMATML